MEKTLINAPTSPDSPSTQFRTKEIDKANLAPPKIIEITKMIMTIDK